MIVTLIGYRGSGKSSVAAPLAAALGWPWIDSDSELQRREGRSIRAMFAEEGEAYFRQQEQHLLAELFQQDRRVIAAGGGAVLSPATRRRMQTAGPVVWLRASLDSLEKRIGQDAATAGQRPNLTATGGRAEIAQVLAERDPLYRECATLSVETDHLAVDSVVCKILEHLRPRLKTL